MNALVTDLFSNAPAQRIAWALVHFLWQGTAVALLLAMVLQLVPRRSSQARWAASCAALGLMVALPVVTACIVPVGVLMGTEPVTEPVAPQNMAALRATDREFVGSTPLVPPDREATERVIHQPTIPPGELPTRTAVPAVTTPWRHRAATFVEPSLPWVLLVWLAGVLGMSAWHVGGWVRLERTKKSSAPLVDPAISTVFQRLLVQLRISRPVRLLESARVAVPMVAGWLRPVLLLPVSALSGLTPEQLEAVLAHELAHIRRYDCLVKLIQAVIETLLFYHPAVWWVSTQIRQESEHCCDALAVELCGNRQSYARALASFAEVGHTARLAAPARGEKLLDRVRRIVGFAPEKDSRSSRWLAGAIAIAAVAIFCASIHLLASAAGVEFEKMSVVIKAPLAPEPPQHIEISSDGTCLYRIEERPKRGEQERWPGARLLHNVDAKRMEELQGLLENAKWLTAPGGEGPALHTDADEWTLTLLRNGRTRTITCHGSRPEPYTSLK